MAISQNGKASDPATAPQQTATAATPAASAPSTALTALELQALQQKELEAAHKAYWDKAKRVAGENGQLAECVEVEPWEDSKGKQRFTSHLALVNKLSDGSMEGSEVFKIPHSKYWAGKEGRLYYAVISVVQIPKVSKDRMSAYNQATCVVSWHEVPMGV
jgi:hypothetical protein